jgi:FKBP-type peptidyl-prolyl cis-trans isomerase
MRSLLHKPSLNTFVLLSGFFLAAHISAQKPVSKQPGIPSSSIKLKNGADSLQYILGAYVGQWITGNGFSLNDVSLFNSGMNNILMNRTRSIPDSIIAPLLAAFQEANQKNKSMLQEQRLFASLKDKPGIGMFPSGIRYLVVQNGKGPRPTESDSIVINMIVKLPEGTVVEDTYQSKKPFDAKTDSFFPALNDVMQLMTEGSRWQLYIPSALAYGDKGTSLIPPYSALVLDLELVKVKRR